MAHTQNESSRALIEELFKELRETVVPISALLGAILGGLVMFEAMTFSRNDLVIASTALAHSLLGPLSVGLIGLILAARISAAQAAEIQGLYQSGASETEIASTTRTVILALGAFVSYVVFIAFTLTGAVIATEFVLSGASSEILDIVLRARHPLEWIGDSIAATLMGAGICIAAFKSATRGATHHRAISRTAGRSVSYGLLTVCVVLTLYWLLLGLS